MREFEIVPIRRPAGKVQIKLARKEGQFFKDRANWLLEALGVYYSRRAGYCLSPERAEMFSKLYKGGWHATMRLMAGSKAPYRFFLVDEDGNDGEKLSLKEALKKIDEIEKQAKLSHD